MTMVLYSQGLSQVSLVRSSVTLTDFGLKADVFTVFEQGLSRSLRSFTVQLIRSIGSLT